MIRHHVLMTFLDPADTSEAVTRLVGLRDQIPTLLELVVDADTVGGEGHAHLALMTSHPDVAGLRAYADDPLHEQVLAWLRPRLASRVVVDAES